ncbi:WD40 repeat domain-containing serine/threonine-protein kinase [Lignipirellula cremea]|nr:WD40 repeat domain-containing serine/threonine-protein kinase [Lignipirellula cremea]
MEEFSQRIATADWQLAALIELVKIDLDRRWSCGSHASLDDYLAQYPELGGREQVALDLVQAEFEIRLHYGDAPGMADYAARFPQHAAALHAWTPSAPSVLPATAQIDTSHALKSSTNAIAGGLYSADLPLGEFGRYRIEKKLGQGGMGAVYLAHDSRLERQVALKVPRFAEHDDPQILERFLREAKAAATIDHPNLCPVYDVGEVDGVHYLSMAYIEGRSLAECLRESGPLSQTVAADLTRKLALALAEAHQHGVVHRDLKPANIMINRRGEPVIMDFGLARRSESEDVRLTQSGAIVGTPAYMAPEQVEGDAPAIGPQTDVYALGVILYELLSGSLPHQGNVAQLLASILRDEPAPLAEVRRDVSADLAAICGRAMAKRLTDRFASAEELAESLHCFLDTAAFEPDAEFATTFIGPPQADSLTRRSRANRMPSIAPTRVLPQRRERRKPLFIAALTVAAILGLTIALGVVYIATDTGHLRIEFNDHHVQVVVKKNGKVVKVIDSHSGTKVQLRRGTYEISLAGGDTARVQPQPTKISIVRGGNEVLRIESIPKNEKGPPPGLAETRVPATTAPATTAPATTAPATSVPESVKPAEKSLATASLVELRAMVEDADSLDARSLAELQNHLHMLVRTQGESLQGMTAAGLLAGLPSQFDQWEGSPGQPALPMAEAGEAAKDPPELIAVLGDVKLRHFHQVRGLAAHPEGKFVASISSNLIFWDTETGHATELLSNLISSGQLAFSPDGKHLAMCTMVGQMYLWDVKTLQLLKRVTPKGRFRCDHWCYSPDGRFLAVARNDSVIDIVDAQAFTVLKQLRVSGDINGIAVLDDSNSLAVSFVKSPVEIWSVASGALQEKLSIVGDRLAASTGLLAVSRDETVQLIDVATRETKFEVATGADIVQMCFNADGSELVTLSRGGSAAVCSMEQQVMSRRIDSGLQQAEHLSAAKNGIYAFAGRIDVSIYNDQTKVLLRNAGPHTHGVHDVDFDAAEQRLASVDYGSNVVVWSLADKSPIVEFNTSENFARLVAFFDESSLAVGMLGNQVGMFSAHNGAPGAHWDLGLNRVLAGGNSDPADFAASADDNSLVALRDDGEVCLWNAASNMHTTWSTYDRNAMQIDITPQLSRLVVKSHNKLYLIDAASPQLESFAAGEIASATAVAISPDGAIIAVGSSTGEIVLVRRSDKTTLKVLRGHRELFNRLKFTGDGRLLVASGSHGALSVWDMQGQRVLCRIQHSEPNSSAMDFTLTRDGRYVAVAVGNGTIPILRLCKRGIREPFVLKGENDEQFRDSAPAD